MLLHDSVAQAGAAGQCAASGLPLASRDVKSRIPPEWWRSRPLSCYIAAILTQQPAHRFSRRESFQVSQAAII